MAMYENAATWSLINGYVGDAMRYLAWWCVGGFIAMGAGWYWGGRGGSLP
ncbi:hypothetical protein GCM10027425_10780 [Alteromonas gracilis]